MGERLKRLKWTQYVGLWVLFGHYAWTAVTVDAQHGRKTLGHALATGAIIVLVFFICASITLVIHEYGKTSSKSG